MRAGMIDDATLVGRYKGVEIRESSKMPRGASAFAIRSGGRSSGRSAIMYPAGKGKADLAAAQAGNVSSTLTHEMAHATPKRSGYRMHQVAQNPRKLGREEGRADFEARTDYRAPTSENRNGYTDMATNESRRRLYRRRSYGQNGKARFVNGYREVADGARNRASDRTSRSATPYVLGGAAVGGGATVGAFQLKGRQRRAQDGKFS